MGGDGQPQTMVQLVTGLIDDGLDPQAAVSRPRWCTPQACSTGI